MARRLDSIPAVAIVGAHQVGKTMLSHFVPKNQNSIYLDLGFEEG
jgi:predicted AAA+ superfamily ATPase